MGGVHPAENKLAAAYPAQTAPLPARAVVPVSQHIGAPATPVVKRGDRVKVGTLIAQAAGFVSAPVHSPVSGTVAKIEETTDASGYRHTSVAIDVEGDEWEDDIDRSPELVRCEDRQGLSPEEIVAKVKAAGIVGMGGAGFPTYIKLTPPEGTSIDCIVINAAECEPYITADHRLMLEHPREIIEGVKLIMKAAKVHKAAIAVEANKPDAIRVMEEATAGQVGISVAKLKTRYPQGGEKQLVEAVTGRRVPPPPAIPAHAGAIVQNVATAFAVYEAVMKNKPLIERYATVSGNRLERNANFIVRTGTPSSMLIDLCGGLPPGDNKVLSGGPMMGKALNDIDSPICKQTNAITVISGAEASRKPVQPCIRCAKCSFVCPMGLEPFLLASLSAKGMFKEASGQALGLCIECGSCQYACPAHRPILDNIRLGKQAVAAMEKAERESAAKK